MITIVFTLENKHPCAGNPCQNGATCVYSGYDYKCVCPNGGGYSGKDCGKLFRKRQIIWHN